MGLPARLRQAFAGLPSDYGSVRVALVLLALFYAGARRLEHLRFLSGDPLVTRFCGLARLPTRRTVANWLRQFTQETLAPLVALNRDLVTEALARLDLPRVTIDVDGSVIRTGATVGWAFRGFNPHHRKDPSYYPLLAHVAQTGHILRLKNRPGNVHDSKQAVPFVREVIDDLRRQLGRRVALEFRMDAAFFQRGILQLLTAQDCSYTIKVGYWSWLPLCPLARGGGTFSDPSPRSARLLLAPTLPRTVARRRPDGRGGKGRSFVASFRMSRSRTSSPSFCFNRLICSSLRAYSSFGRARSAFSAPSKNRSRQ
jgi:Transposase DDE domain group 1